MTVSSRFAQGFREGLPPEARHLKSSSLIGKTTGALIFSALAWVARTSIVVITLKIWGVLPS